MQPTKPPQVRRTDAFDRDVAELSSKYPEIEAVIQEYLDDGFTSPYMIQHVQVADDLCAIRMDYRPAGTDGKGRLLMTYHASKPFFKPGFPIRWFTLISLTELP